MILSCLSRPHIHTALKILCVYHTVQDDAQNSPEPSLHGQQIDSDEESNDAGRGETAADEAEDDEDEEQNAVRFVPRGNAG